MKRKFYCDVFGPVTEESILFLNTWPPTSDPHDAVTRYAFEVDFPDLEATDVPATPAVPVSAQQDDEGGAERGNV